MNSRIMLLLLLLIVVSCNEKARQQRKKKRAVRTEQRQTEQQEPAITVHYTLDTLMDQAEIDSFKARYTPEQLQVILQLNRYSKNLRKGVVLSIPDTVFTSFEEYTTFPKHLNIADTFPKLIIVALRVQSFGIYENGMLVRCGPVSSGKKTAPTPPGRYHTNWKSKLKTSTIDENWIMPWYFNLQNKEGIALHQYELPGYAASHACVRLEEENAKWIYGWADQWTLDTNGRIATNGTPVVVFGSYDFDGIQPWRKLPENPKIMELTEAELEEIKNGLMVTGY